MQLRDDAHFGTTVIVIGNTRVASSSRPDLLNQRICSTHLEH